MQIVNCSSNLKQIVFLTFIFSIKNKIRYNIFETILFLSTWDLFQMVSLRFCRKLAVFKAYLIHITTILPAVYFYLFLFIADYFYLC